MEEWIRIAAAAMLDLTAEQTRNLGKRDALRMRMKVCKLPGRSGGMRKRCYLVRSEVAALAAQRWAEKQRREDARSRGRGEEGAIGWGDRFTLPERLGYERPDAGTREGEAEIGVWMTAREAAETLEVTPDRVGELVETGMLPAYQRRPGKRGSRLWLPSYYVMALAERPEHLERRERYAAGAEGAASRLVPEWEEKDLSAYDPYQPSPLTEHDYGEFYTARQAALLLGITVGSVRRLRKRGRLTGYHRKRYPHRDRYRGPIYTVGRQWWFFRKEEVRALMADPAYRRRRQIQAESRTVEAREIEAWFERTQGRRGEGARGRKTVEEERMEEWYEWWRKAHLLGRDPKGYIRVTGFLWDGVVETY
jgi:hypothetical protein